MIVELLIGGGIWLTGRVAEWTIERILDRTYDYYATDSRIRRAIDNIRGGLGDPASIRIILDAIKSARESDPGFRRAMQDITTRDLPEFAMDPFPYPPTLFGRDLQLGDLRTLLDCDTPNVVQVVGTSGVGKTVLAAQAIFDLACDYVRLELDRTETPESIIVRLYELLHWQAAPERPHKDLIGNILEAWKARDCILVLDNLHVLLDDHAKPKDDLAKLLLDRLGGSGQKLLTLGWPSTTAMGGANELVRVFLVEGIDEDAGEKKLRAEGIVGSPETITLEQVVLNLDGNPRMLEGVARLIEYHDNRVTILDENKDWVADQASTLKAMWDSLGSELQELLAGLCVFRWGRNAERLSRFFGWPEAETREHINSVLWWRFAKSVDGQKDYAPDHDLIRSMIRTQVGEDRLMELHRLAANLWKEEGSEIGRKSRPTTKAEIQPLLEAGFHMAQRQEGDAIIKLLSTVIHGTTVEDLADWFGAWQDRLELWQVAAAYASTEEFRSAAIHNLGVVYLQIGDWDAALAEYKASLEIFERLGDLQNMAKSRHQIGIICQMKGDWDAALVEYKASLEISEQLGDQQGIAMSRHQIGRVYQEKGDLDAALVEYKASLEIEEQLGNQQGVAQSRHQIGIICQMKGDLDAALVEYKASLEIEEQLGNQQGVAQSRHQIGNVFYLKGDLDAALVEYKASLEIKEQLGDQPGVAKSRHQIGTVYHYKGDLDEALTEYKASLEIEERLGNQQGMAESNGQIGLLFRQLKRFSEAFECTSTALSIFTKISDPRVSQAANDLAVLRREWGAAEFDKAWKEKTGKDVPEEIVKGSEGLGKQE